MTKHTASWNHFECEGLDLELFICSEILKLRSLHYGYWNAHARPTLANLRTAQQRYTNTLIDLIPAHAVNILDVGCGIGDVARALVSRGLRVTAISPDKNHEKYFTTPIHHLTFIPTTFEAFTSSGSYDAILMSESHNYFSADTGFEQCRRYLKTNGYLLVSGIFRRQAGNAFGDVISDERDYVEKAGQYALHLLRRRDITKRILPTLAFAHDTFEEHIKPVLGLIDHYLISSTSLKTAILQTLMGRQINNGFNILRYYQDRTDPALFEQNCRYLRLLFRLA